MDEIGAATPDHDAVGVGIGLDGRDGVREPVQGQAGVDDTYHGSVFVFQGLAVTGYHLAGVGGHVIVYIRLGPARFFQQFGHEIPVRIEVLIVVASALDGTDGGTVMLGVGREITAPAFEVIGLEGDGTVVEVGVIVQHAPAVRKHGIRFVQMPLYQPFRHFGSHFHPVEDTLDPQGSLVQNLCGAVHSLLAHSLSGLVEQEAEGADEDEGGKNHHPQAHADGELATDIGEDSIHGSVLHRLFHVPASDYLPSAGWPAVPCRAEAGIRAPRIPGPPAAEALPSA